MTELIYLQDSYKRTHTTRIQSVERKGHVWHLTLESTILYPEGGGQPSDKGIIIGKNGTATVKHVRLAQDTVIHECSIQGSLSPEDTVEVEIDWQIRYLHMRLHSAGHIVHEAVKQIAPHLVPTKGHHGNEPYIEYIGSLPIDKQFAIEKAANAIIANDLPISTELVTIQELIERSSWVPSHLPKNKPLRIMTIGSFDAVPDGGTQVQHTGEVGPVTIVAIENDDTHVRIRYAISQNIAEPSSPPKAIEQTTYSPTDITRALMDAERDAKEHIASSNQSFELLKLEVLGAKSPFAHVRKNIQSVAPEHRQEVGKVINIVKERIEAALQEKQQQADQTAPTIESQDLSMPGILPPMGHVHIVTQAIMEITRIFERIGFTRVRHPEVDWDYYAFESLNMPKDHPARDEWETFFITYPGKPGSDPHKQKIVLTPHTSNGQVREMEKNMLPIRMINIAKCYRRQIDVSHTPMFHQFEGLYIDKDVSIGHLKGVFDHFVKNFFGPNRKTRLRPFHFQFTEPSFEVDINCGICLGSSTLSDGSPCRLCKAGWLELGGAGMVHPNVLIAGGIDPEIYSGFAFGWGIERTSMMKSGTKLDDIRLLYSNDVRFLEQF